MSYCVLLPEKSCFGDSDQRSESSIHSSLGLSRLDAAKACGASQDGT